LEIHTLTSPANVSVRFIAVGGAIIAIEAPDRNGRLANIVLAHREIETYRTQRIYLGTIVGRYANRIANARFDLDGVTCELAPTDGTSSVHGGRKGFDKAEWQVALSKEQDAEIAVLRHVSPNGDEGYPGTFTVEMRYRLSADGTLEIAYEATTDRPTVVNLTNHSYFNLAGEGSGDVLGHTVEIFADRYTPADCILIPTGEIAPVAETPFDFRAPRAIGARIREPHPQMLAGRGYDLNYVLEPTANGEPVLACRVVEPVSGRTLEISTTEPGIQFYTGNMLDGTVSGPTGRTYRQSDGFCFEPHHYPDSPNKPGFPSCRLDPGDVYRSRSLYRFGIA
jgi:aldose 1-epimerase